MAGGSLADESGPDESAALVATAPLKQTKSAEAGTYCRLTRNLLMCIPLQSVPAYVPARAPSPAMNAAPLKSPSHGSTCLALNEEMSCPFTVPVIVPEAPPVVVQTPVI